MEISKEIYDFLKDLNSIINDGNHVIKRRFNDELRVVSFSEMESVLLKHKNLHPTIEFKIVNPGNKSVQSDFIQRYACDAKIYRFLSFLNDDAYGYIGLTQDGVLAIENYERGIKEEAQSDESLKMSKEANEISKEAKKKAKTANTIAIIALILSVLISITSIIISVILSQK